MEDFVKFTEIYKRIQSYPSMSIPPGTDAEKSSIGGVPLLNGIAQSMSSPSKNGLCT